MHVFRVLWGVASTNGVWSKSSVVWRHHIYKAIWTPYVGQRLKLSCEDDNDHDDLAVYIDCRFLCAIPASHPDCKSSSCSLSFADFLAGMCNRISDRNGRGGSLNNPKHFGQKIHGGGAYMGRETLMVFYGTMHLKHLSIKSQIRQQWYSVGLMLLNC